MLTGSLVAIVTPMREGGALDLPALRRLIDFHVTNGTAGIVIVGTTGESPTLDFKEHIRVIELAVQFAKGRVPVIGGTGANATYEAIELQKAAKDVGANAGLSVNPYYNKPSQEGLFHHFMAIADKVDLPIVLYNIPGRTAKNMEPETIARLGELPTIVAVKESTGSMDQASQITHLSLWRDIYYGNGSGASHGTV